MQSPEDQPDVADIGIDAQIGRRVHQLMWDRQITQTAFGQRISMDQSSVAKRLRGKLMGHQSLSTTQIYTGVSEARKRAGIHALPPIPIPARSGREQKAA